ncbi:MAG: DJ-1/PfpI family protein [Planctomycetes bacterium]|nr:DJ-1/PfpI family protein [Planctomycetota bacterium]
MRTPLLPSLLSMFLLSAPPAQDPAVDLRARADAAFVARDWQRAAELYGRLSEGDPGPETSYRLGYCLHVLGRLDEALPWHERAAAQADADPRLAATASYNIACVHALRGHVDEAFAALRRAARSGFRRTVQLQRDPDLATLRADPRFAPLIAELEDLADLVLVVVHDGVETLDFAGPVEVFTSARDALGNPAYRVRFVAPRKRPVRPQHWRTLLEPDFGTADCPQPTILVVPGGDTGVLDEDPEFVAWLQRTAPGCRHVLSVCTGAYALARAGLLDGRRATTHHGSRAVLARQYPAVQVVDAKVVDEGHVITAAGVSSGLDGALAVVQRDHGEARANEVARYMEYDWQALPAPAPASASPPTSRPEVGRRAREAAAEPLYQRALAVAGGPRGEALTAVERALTGGACPARTLLEQAFQPMRHEPRFREALRRATWGSSTLLVLDDEPGARLSIDGSIEDATGAPVAGALLYLWHTDADGTYASNSMDEQNPRLYGFVRSDGDGRFSLRTIRPAAYRGEDGKIEQHVHGLVTTADGRRYVARLGFADDPFWQDRDAPDWVAKVTAHADSSQRVSWRIRLDERARR